MRKWIAVGLFLGSTMTAFAQLGEFGIMFGKVSVRNGNLGVFPAALSGASSDLDVTTSANFRFSLNFVINSWRYFGHELGYAYNRGTLTFNTIAAPGSPAAEVQSSGMGIHQGYYNFLAYATPEGSKIRPYAGAGVHFSTFYPPGASVFAGNGQTKFGINAGGGLKVRVSDMFLVRFDVHDFFQGKPDLYGFINQSGWLQLVTVTGGLSFTF